MKHINFKHCGKVYSVKQHDKIVCFKTSEEQCKIDHDLFMATLSVMNSVLDHFLSN